MLQRLVAAGAVWLLMQLLLGGAYRVDSQCLLTLTHSLNHSLTHSLQWSLFTWPNSV